LLLGFGWTLAPAAVPIAPAIVLIGYFVVARISVPFARQGNVKTQWVTAACGTISAAVLIRALMVQYFGRTANNAVMVAVVFGLWFVAGVMATAQTGRIRDAVISSTLSAQIASLANVGFILASYYVLRGSALQQQFFRVEGTYDDFARSGMSDFSAFVIGDLFGGAFFHLLLGALCGALLGAIGGVMTVGIHRVLSRSVSVFCVALVLLPASLQTKWRFPVVIEALQDVPVEAGETARQRRGVLYVGRSEGRFTIKKGQRLLMVKVYGEGECRIRFQDKEYDVSSCPWMDGFTDHQQDVFRVLSGDSGNRPTEKPLR
jgi:hypothetical protein